MSGDDEAGGYPLHLLAETAVIATAMLGGDDLEEMISAGVEAGDFIEGPYREVWRRVLSLRADGKAVDPWTVAESPGDAAYLTALLDRAPKLRAVALTHARQVREDAAKRAAEAQEVALRNELITIWQSGGPLDAGKLREMAARVEAREAPAKPGLFRQRSYTLADLDADRNRVLLPLGTLPLNHGLGAKLDELIGGGLAPGDLFAVGAGEAGGGKTALVMQVADGLALRSDELVRLGAPGVVTPILIASEMDPRALNQRTLARLCGWPTASFRGQPAHGPAGLGSFPDPRNAAAPFLADDGAMTRLCRWVQMARPPEGGTHFLEALKAGVTAWVAETKRRHPGREVWPVVVIDPIQRWQDPTQTEVEALNTLVEGLDQLADENGWIVLLTSDTNKTSANASGDASLAGIFRGSYKLMHACDVALVLTREDGDEKKKIPADPPGVVRLTLAKNRNGPLDDVALQWRPEVGLRFEPAGAAQRAKMGEPAGAKPSGSRYAG